jgi:hypothetical protein
MAGKSANVIEQGHVGDVAFRVRRMKRNWRAEISGSGSGWLLACHPSGNKEQQMDMAIRAASYANAHPDNMRRIIDSSVRKSV